MEIKSSEAGENQLPTALADITAIKDTVPRETSAAKELNANEVPKKKKRTWLTLGGGILALLKFGKVGVILKGLLVTAKFSKFLITALSMLLMIVAYTFTYGWSYAIGIVILLFIHEMGHFLTSRRLGLDTSLPIFIPFVGAFIQMKQTPKDAKIESIVAIAGPLAGALGASICLLIGNSLPSRLFLALAYFGFVLTVFNLIPAHPLDGGRIATALSPKLWLVGIPLMLGFSLYFFNPIGLLITAMSVSRAWKVWKDRNNPYFSIDTPFRVKIGAAYFLLFILSVYFVFNIYGVSRA